MLRWFDLVAGPALQDVQALRTRATWDVDGAESFWARLATALTLP